MFEHVCDAVNVQVLRNSLKIDYRFDTQDSTKDVFYEEDGKLIVQRDDIGLLKKVLPKLIKGKRAFNTFCCPETRKTISWKAVQETVMQHRSVDDLRNLWSQRIMPIIDPNGKHL